MEDKAESKEIAPLDLIPKSANTQTMQNHEIPIIPSPSKCEWKRFDHFLSLRS